MNYQEAKFIQSDGGYWCQGDCTFISALDGVEAVNTYRTRLASGQIGINSEFPDGLQKLRMQEQIGDLTIALQLATEALEEVWSLCSHDHWEKVGLALEAIRRLKGDRQ